MTSWDRALEASARVTGLMPDSVDAAIVMCLADLCRDGNLGAAAMRLSTISKVYEFALVKFAGSHTGQ